MLRSFDVINKSNNEKADNWENAEIPSTANAFADAKNKPVARKNEVFKGDIISKLGSFHLSDLEFPSGSSHSTKHHREVKHHKEAKHHKDMKHHREMKHHRDMKHHREKKHHHKDKKERREKKRSSKKAERKLESTSSKHAARGGISSEGKDINNGSDDYLLTIETGKSFMNENVDFSRTNLKFDSQQFLDSDNEEYEKRFSDVKRYIPFLEMMIDRHRQMNDHKSLKKMESLHEVLTQSKKKYVFFKLNYLKTTSHF